MAIDRRTLLAGAAATACAAPFDALAGEAAYLSAFTSDGGETMAALLDRNGIVTGAMALPARGHGGAFHPSGRDAVVFARRPGLFGLVFERATMRIRHRLVSPEGRHFYGHGVFAPGGRLLYTTENDFEAERGVIGVWDAARDYARVGELPSHGIGPHDLALLPDGHTLVVANGGILTHPDSGRLKLNLADMTPSLVAMDVRDGQIVAETRLPRDLHQLSIRHLALDRNGTVGVAMQYEGPAEDEVPLVFAWRHGAADLMRAPRPLERRMKHYCGSIAADRSGGVFAVSCPRGGLVTFWSTADGELLRIFDMEDGCGVAPAAETGTFWISSGTGRRLLFDARDGAVIAERSAPAHWDNHIIAG